MTQQTLAGLRKAISRTYLADEEAIINELVSSLEGYDPVRIGQCAETLVAAVRQTKNRQTAIEAFLNEYQLNSREGVVLMGIAEALLRIPDSRTQDLFLQEKLTGADWQSHIKHSESWLVNLATKALFVAGDLEGRFELPEQEWPPILDRLFARLGAPVVRTAVRQAMKHLASQFVFAESMQEAAERCRQNPLFLYSFDMLGEAALTAGDAERFFQAYSSAIQSLAGQASSDIYANSGISIKLSALCPRYEPMQQARAVEELTEKLLALAKDARAANISVTVDAEETERLEMSLAVFAAVFNDSALSGWPGLGLAVQAYQKRALPVIRWLAGLAEEGQKRIPLRLVKGAYWDSEIKRAQENGLSDYPVFTHKAATDVSYLACARAILARSDVFYPQFASHNAHTIAAVYQFGKRHQGYEFQRLHGMGESLYREVIEVQNWQIPCRVYAPVGDHRELLPYLVRRLLENGANTSFINQISHPEMSVAELTSDPVDIITAANKSSSIVLPRDLFGKERLNSSGLNLADLEQLDLLRQDLEKLAAESWTAMPIINDTPRSEGRERPVVNPCDNRLTVGSVILAEPPLIDEALSAASEAFQEWRLCPAAKRAEYLKRAGELLEQHRLELVSLCIREGGRTIKDALAEVREAVDYCRYYAQSALDLFEEPVKLPGPTGEDNRLYHYGRGVYVCISPWNFPIAIFIGQITAALAAGNVVIAKPASQTVLTAMLCIRLLHEAGIPAPVLQFLPMSGRLFGDRLLPDRRVAGIAFTGSTETAQSINLQLARHHQAIVPVIAETGGQNVMIADSSALLEQLVQDVIVSAFNSAGQRCSALRVLFVQEDIADKAIKMLIGAMRELTVGDPGLYRTDVGPVIDHAAIFPLADHLEIMRKEAEILYQLPLPEGLQHGSFFPPCLIELKSLPQLNCEIFGPVLHLIRYRESELDAVIAAVNATGYGLTLGIHSRIEAVADTIRRRIKAGNVYVNRNMIGAVVGVQPFGGMGLSGTGPKAGGPDYLRRFAVEQTVTVNTAAIGGNAALLAQDLR